MNTHLPSPPRVPVEFLGLARVYRNQVQAADQACNVALRSIINPLRWRLASKPTLRPEHVIDAGRVWSKLMPSAFRIGETRMIRTRREFVIAEDRISVSWLQAARSGERERGVSVCRLVVAAHKGDLREDWRPVACVSLHALARRIERGSDRRHAALTSDLARLLTFEADQCGQVMCDDGYWLGDLVDLMDETAKSARQCRNVRTFVGHENVGGMTDRSNTGLDVSTPTARRCGRSSPASGRERAVSSVSWASRPASTPRTARLPLGRSCHTCGRAPTAFP
jgi:hypothetical protein